jgi:lysozyme
MFQIKTMRFNDNGTQLVCHFESLHDGDLSAIGAQPKMDPVGIWTVGYGHALWNVAEKRWYKGDKDKAAVYKMYPSLTEPEARILLKTDIPQYEQAVLKMIRRRDLSENEFSALVSFAYNCGTHYQNALGMWVPYKIWSLVDKRVSVSEMYNYWCTSVIKGGGKILAGLVRRRKSEAMLYCFGKLQFLFAS